MAPAWCRSGAVMKRRDLLSLAATAAGGPALISVAAGNARASSRRREPPSVHARRPIVEAHDGTRLHYEDWGTGAPIFFVAPWALDSTWWEYQIAALAGQGVRCIAIDRRGHGRSGPASHGLDF